jgi:uncharacterized metal-binding protein YceD (DUF177 family)
LKRNKELNISFAGLNIGKYNFEYLIDDSFFADIEYSEIKKGNLKVNICLEKRSNMLIFDINITGTVNVPCDRCLDYFDYEINTKNKLLAKFGHKNSIKEDEDEIIIINESDGQLNITHNIYEYIVLSLPYQIIHEDDEFGRTKCNHDVIDKLTEHLSKNDNIVDFDPRWNILKTMNNN